MVQGDVDALLANRAHPHNGVVFAIRAELLAVPGVHESVKWNAPNYALADDFATMHLRRPDAVQLILHTGAQLKPTHPEIEVGVLPGFARRAARNRLVLTFRGAQLSNDERTALRRMIHAWTAQLT